MAKHPFVSALTCTFRTVLLSAECIGNVKANLGRLSKSSDTQRCSLPYFNLVGA